MKLRTAVPLASLLLGASLAACARPPATAMSTERSSPATVAAALPKVLVHKSASCTCCAKWVQHLRQAGFTVDVRNEGDLEPVKNRLGVPYALHTCHTAEVGGYFVEGHVPADDIKRLLKERPKGKGLALPGMPAGSPGMEVPSGQVQPYTVSLVRDGNTTTPFAQHGPSP